MQVDRTVHEKKPREPRKYDRVHTYMMSLIKGAGYKTSTLRQQDKWLDRGLLEAYQRGEVVPMTFDMSDSDAEDPEPETLENPGDGAGGDQGGEPKRAKTAPLKIRLAKGKDSSAPSHVWPDGTAAEYDTLGNAVKDLAKRKLVTYVKALSRSLHSKGSLKGHNPVKPKDAAGKEVDFWVFSA